MVYLLLGFILFMLFALSVVAGYILGKGYVKIPKKLTEEEKKLIEKQEKEFEEMRKQYNEVFNQLIGVTDDGRS